MVISLGKDSGNIASWFLQRLLRKDLAPLEYRLAKRGMFLALDFLEMDDYSRSFERAHETGQVAITQTHEDLHTLFQERGFTPEPSFILKANTQDVQAEVNNTIEYYDKDLLESLLEIFAEEAMEHLETITSLLETPLVTSKIVHEIYRAAHTLKGAAATVGLTNIASSAFELETYYHHHDDRSTLPTKDEIILTIMVAIMLGETIIKGGDGTATIKAIFSFGSNKTDKKDTESDIESFLWADNDSAPSLDQDDDNSRATDAYEPLDDMAAILKEIFDTEADEHISNLEANMEKLDRGENVIYELFRITHTLKGAAATVGNNKISNASHVMEDFFDWLNEAKIQPPPDATPLLYHCTSLLRKAIKSESDVQKEIIETLSKAKAFCLSQSENSQNSTTKKTEEKPSLGNRKIKRVTGSDHSVKDSIIPFEKDKLASKYLKVPVTNIDKLIGNSEELTLVRTQIEKSRDEFTSITSDLFLSHQTLRTYLLEERSEMAEADRLERLQELEVEIAELIHNLEHSSSNLTTECHSLLKVSSYIQHNLIDLRITTLELLFLKLKQAIREIAFQTGKEIQIDFNGTLVELDKGVVDNLATPLIQIVRNCVTHGIENPASRMAKGKSPKGVVSITAKQEGNFVHIKIGDDGEGIELSSIKKIIMEQELVDVIEDLDHFSQEELLEAIFLPGFTTKKESGAHAGRGIGLNLVREKVRRLGGDITVTTLRGEGTEFTVRVPVTTFISQALLFQLGHEVYGIPISYVIEFYEYISKQPLQPGSRILWNGESIPIVPLYHYFGLETNFSPGKPISILILSHGGKYFGITIDSIIGLKDVTVKPLGKLLLALKYFSGAIISGAGTIQMIFNIPYLAALARPALGFKIIRKTLKHVTAPKILVVDDSKSVREAASRVLVNAGYEVTKASDGWEAWNLLHEEEFDLLLTDLEMPRMNGYELITELKRDSILHTIPVVVLSSRTGEKSRKKVAEAKADTFVSKPIKPLILLKVLQDYVPINETTMTRRILLFATQNRNKIQELLKLLQGVNLDIWGLDKFEDLPDVIEDGKTFEENAIKKARMRAKQTGLPSLADDSGLEVDFLNGEPGVYSARYGGPNADDREKNDLLLSALQGAKNRKARFVSVIAFCPNPRTSEVITVRGECEGEIGYKPRGESGFGYDPIFMLPSGRTMAELSLTEKNRISHRANAFNKILQEIQKFIDTE
jgi:non-canonical purine NTP pyrophosphatase (RdgB/HAM1 family)